MASNPWIQVGNAPPSPEATQDVLAQGQLLTRQPENLNPQLILLFFDVQEAPSSGLSWASLDAILELNPWI